MNNKDFGISVKSVFLAFSLLFYARILYFWNIPVPGIVPDLEIS
jgi:hypothetical protein